MGKLFTAKVASQRRVTIPLGVCEAEGIGEGDYVVVHIGKVEQKRKEAQA